jgi:hypothetical protein
MKKIQKITLTHNMNDVEMIDNNYFEKTDIDLILIRPAKKRVVISNMPECYGVQNIRF